MDSLWPILDAGFAVFMELAQLALDYLKVIIWPTAVLTLALIYRRPLVSVLHRLRKASGWGVSVEAEARDLAIDSQIVDASEQSVAPPLVAEVDTEQPVTPQTTPDQAAEPEHASDPARDDEVRQLLSRVERLESERASVTHMLRAARVRDGDVIWSSDAELSDSTSGQMRKNRVEAAWITLIGQAYTIGTFLEMPRAERTLPGVLMMLAELGYVKTGPWRIARRLTSLYETIQDDPNPPSEEVVNDFVVAAQNLKNTLQAVEKRLTVRPIRRANGEVIRMAGNDPVG